LGIGITFIEGAAVFGRCELFNKDATPLISLSVNRSLSRGNDILVVGAYFLFLMWVFAFFGVNESHFLNEVYLLAFCFDYFFLLGVNQVVRFVNKLIFFLW